ncbi:MAG TPA: protease HtpX [Methanophagales archaeon]|nr:protease HtpX [Methanophagales archaeon]
MNNRVKLLLLWMLLVLPIVIVGGAIGKMLALRIFGLIMLTLSVFVLLLVLVLCIYLFSDKILRRWYHAKEVSSPLSEIVSALAIRADIPAPKVFTVESTMPNVFATGRNAEYASIIVTDALVELLDKEELEAVLAHELAHVKTGDTLLGTVVAVLSGTLTALATCAFWCSIFLGFGQEDDPAPNLIKFFVTALVAPIAAVIIQLALSSSREYAADEQSVCMYGKPNKLISALEKLEHRLKSDTFKVNPSHVHMFIMNPLHDDLFTLLDIHLPTYNSLFNTHPATKERVERLKEIGFV